MNSRPARKLTAAAFVALLALGGPACTDEDDDGSTTNEEMGEVEENVERGVDEVEQQVEEGAEEDGEGQH